jgi:transketolase
MADEATREAFGEALVALGGDRPDVVVLDGDLGNSTRIDLFAEAFPDRFFQMGIAEQNMIGVAAGLAAGGLLPFAVTFAAFATHRALDQIRVSVAQPGLPVIVVGAYAGLLAGRTGKTHVCLEDLAIFRALPGMTVLAPGDGAETRAAVAAAAAWGGPVYLRLTRDPSPPIGVGGQPFEIGRGVLLRSGGDVGLVSTGLQTARALQAADTLAELGTSASVLHLPTVKPLDVDAVVELADATDLIVTAEDHSIVGGIGSAVAEVLAEHRPTRVVRVGVHDRYAESALNDELLERYGLSAGHIVAAVTEARGARRGA